MTTASGIIDTDFDDRADTPPGKDLDSHSPTLRRHYQLVWSKPLPDGTPFALPTSTKGRYLHHASARGEFTLTSDSVVHSYRTWARMAHVTSAVSAAELDEFQRLGYTIGGMMIFPGVRRPGVRTINGDRGLNRAIADRMDLTLECIRLHSAGGTSPMRRTLAACAGVTFFVPFTGFDLSPLPESVDAYRAYRDASLTWVRARNARIDTWVESGL